MAKETELKLELDPEAAAFLEASDLLSGPPYTAKQHAIYFDTPGQRLQAEGMSLRIRQEGRKRTQTLKIADGPAAGLFARSETDMPVKANQLVHQPDSPLIDLLGDQIHLLAPAFEVSVERRAWLLKLRGSSIELVMDRGMAKVAGRSASINEMELELKSGDIVDLFALARRLDQIAPVRLGVLSKAERGYRLLGAAVEAHKADPVTLDRMITTAAAFRQIALACIRHYRLNEALLLDTWRPAALHQMRVSLRRLRASFTIFKPILDPVRADHFSRALRGRFAILGEARNIDVLLDHCPTHNLRDEIMAARSQAYAHVKDELMSDAGRRLMLDLLEWLMDGDWLKLSPRTHLRDTMAADFAGAVLDRQRKRFKKHGKMLKTGSDEERHRVRKDAKKLRYASEFFTTLFGTVRQQRRYGQFIEALEDVQDQLGILNDHSTARELIDRLFPSKRDDLVSLLGDTPTRKAIKRADHARADLVDLKPFWR
ncbi:CHAD domain-containing protein [Sphingobium sp. AP49]|uniref:CYTH and CHAD domain-containing protein n=1 Tax=Sphingobium sp. AP49 TaxID=1144307 RepID=UPI00026ECAC9|nr:CHAD domain-containing protein [Sphingobium sp. AP49]WHO37963.1 CHAD domain-containing protein [Sphingobium sp. AP49]